MQPSVQFFTEAKKVSLEVPANSYVVVVPHLATDTGELTGELSESGKSIHLVAPGVRKTEIPLANGSSREGTLNLMICVPNPAMVKPKKEKVSRQYVSF